MKLGLEIRSQFPLFSRDPAGQPTHYLDSAASSLKPRLVIDRIAHYLSFEHANIHRGAYALSAKATENYDRARVTVQKFLNAESSDQIIFTKSSTEGINLVARSLERQFKSGDTILLSLLEHHSNIVPWQLLAERKALKIEFAGINRDATLNLSDLAKKLAECKPKLLAITAVSNAFGSITPIAEVIELAKKHRTWVLVDASQCVMHQRLDLADLDPDFLVFTGHKLYGPTGVGVLYGKRDLLEKMDPFLGGGDMIQEVTVEGSTWAEIPRKFEAGTPAIAEVIALGTAIEFVSGAGLDRISAHERFVFESGFSLLSKEPGVTVHGPVSNQLPQAPILAFSVQGVHPHDLASIADRFHVQIRAGHHCAMPALRALNLSATARASIGMYSDVSDFDALIQAIREAKRLLSV